MREVFGQTWPTGACPDCPECGHPPRIVVGPTQAFCGTDTCPVLAWNPSLTAAANRANTGQVDLSGLFGDPPG